MVFLFLTLAWLMPASPKSAPGPTAAETGQELMVRAAEVLRQAKLERKRRRSRKQRRRALAAFLLAGGGRKIRAHRCMLESGINPLYLLPRYAPRFHHDSSTPQVVVIGDSTAAISELVSGFHDRSRTRIVGVPGNRVCHMLITLRYSIPVPPTEALVVMTLGGNDLLAGLAEDELLKQTAALQSELRRLYPGRRLVGVGIHPVRISGAVNRRIAHWNVQLRRLWTKDEGACFVNPTSLFHLQADGLPDARDFLPGDKIHYGARIARALRTQIRRTCGVPL